MAGAQPPRQGLDCRENSLLLMANNLEDFHVLVATAALLGPKQALIISPQFLVVQIGIVECSSTLDALKKRCVFYWEAFPVKPPSLFFC